MYGRTLLLSLGTWLGETFVSPGQAVWTTVLQQLCKIHQREQRAEDEGYIQHVHHDFACLNAEAVCLDILS